MGMENHRERGREGGRERNRQRERNLRQCAGSLRDDHCWTTLNTWARSYMWVSFMRESSTKCWKPFFLLCPNYQQGARSKVEQLGFKRVLCTRHSISYTGNAHMYQEIVGIFPKIPGLSFGALCCHAQLFWQWLRVMPISWGKRTIILNCVHFLVSQKWMEQWGPKKWIRIQEDKTTLY